MTFKQFNNNLKIKDTVFDRRRKLSKNQVEEIKELYNTSDATIKELADKFKVSPTAISYHLSSDAFKVKQRINRMMYYYSKSEEERRTDNKKWKDSILKYKQDLYTAFKTNN